MKKTLHTVLILTAVLATAAFATTVQKLTFEEIVDHSVLIVEGQVASVTVIEDEGVVHSRVLIKVLGVLKGEYPGEFVELDFLGGKGEHRTIIVAGQDIPEAGEKGFYFVENMDSPSVNPLTGWSQGHFRIKADLKGNEYLETDIQHEVVEITHNKNAVLAEKLRNMRFSHALVEKAYFNPVTPEELRDAVSLFMAE